MSCLALPLHSLSYLPLPVYLHCRALPRFTFTYLALPRFTFTYLASLYFYSLYLPCLALPLHTLLSLPCPSSVYFTYLTCFTSLYLYSPTCLAMPCLVLASLILPCLVLSCLILCCFDLPCLVSVCWPPLTCLPCLVLPCLALVSFVLRCLVLF